MGLSSGGIISGLDTKTMIAQLVAIEKLPIQALEKKQSDCRSQISKWGKINSFMSDFKKSLEGIASKEDLLSVKATSSDIDALTVTATGEAKPGNYRVKISQRAQEEKDRSVKFDSIYAKVKAGTLSLKVKDEEAVNITINEGDTLSKVIDSINASGAKVFASTISDGSGTYLSLVAEETGHVVGASANPSDAIIITETSTGTEGLALGLTETQQAKNAKFSIDDLNIEKEKNTITDVLSGVTLNLLKETGTDEELNLTLEGDSEETKKKIQKAFDAYNAIMRTIHSEFTVTAETDRSGTLAGDNTLRQLQSAFHGVVTNVIPGAEGTYKSLAQIGMKTQNDGTLLIDSTKLGKALDTDFSGVAELFVKDADGLVDKLTEIIKSYTDTRDGMIKARTDGINKSIKDLDKNIARIETRATNYQERMTKQFSALEQALLKIQQQGNAVSSF
jgi:flagellar hook-associated protein 2